MTHSQTTPLIVPVILSGGSGSRLWPLSRQAYPKQFLLAPNSDKSFLQETVERVKNLNGFKHLIVSGNESHRFHILEQLEEIGVTDATVILEPVGRNTAPAMGLVAHYAKAHLPEGAQLLFLPSDHFIKNTNIFLQTLEKAEKYTQKNLITLGIKPTFPATGYGYIQTGGPVGDGVFQVQKFVEKPDAATAEIYLQNNGTHTAYFWNGGIFISSAHVLLNALEKCAPKMAESIQHAAHFELDRFFVRPDKNAFEACPSDSIDYAVMEKADNICVIPFNGDWSDIGSFQALWDVSEKDHDGNVTQGHTVLHNCKDCYVYAEGAGLVAATDLEQQIIVHTPDATLIVPTEQAQNVKEVYTQLKEAGDTRYITHTTDHRPWGGFENLSEGQQDVQYKVKHLWVKPGGRLSLQSHTQRSEHWIVLAGVATVTKDEEITTLQTGESTFIPVGTKHRLENTGTDMLHLIEVQTGMYFGEDDIKRYDDVYGRQ